MRGWDLTFSFDPDSPLPLFVQLARTLSEDIRAGRLRPGDRLPGTRTLAATLGVHRNTVLAAYDELLAEGFLETRPQRGTFVSSALPDPRPRRFSRGARRAGMPAQPGFDLGAAEEPLWPPLPPPGALVLAGGTPDLRLLPTGPLARAYRRALSRGGRRLLAYQEPQGHPRLREAVAAMVTALRGTPVEASSVLVTRGSQMALDLVARVLLSPGDVVAVESLGYRPAWSALRRSGAELRPVPVDEHGVRTSRLHALAEQGRLRAVYVTPHHQYPTTATLSAGRRMELLELARRHRVAIIEDDYDHEFHYDGHPVLPLLSADVAGVVVYVGTLSKILAPGLRLGFVVAPPRLIDELARARAYVDRQGDHVVEAAVAELLEEGEVQRHARRARRAYRARRDALDAALTESLGDVLSWRPPAGGMALWAKVAPGIDVERWAERSAREGVVFTPARPFAFDGRARPFARLGFAALTPEEIREAVRRMRRGLED